MVCGVDMGLSESVNRHDLGKQVHDTTRMSRKNDANEGGGEKKFDEI